MTGMLPSRVLFERCLIRNEPTITGSIANPL